MRAGADLELGVEQALVDLVADREQRPPVGLGEQAAGGEAQTPTARQSEARSLTLAAAEGAAPERAEEKA